MAQIAANKTDWIYRSMMNADKVLIIDGTSIFGGIELRNF